MSQDAEATKEVAPVDTVTKDAANKERIRILTLILNSKDVLTAEYKQLIKHTGGLVTASMGVAYARALNDIFKLISKGPTDV